MSNSSDQWMQLYQSNFDHITTDQVQPLHPTTTTATTTTTTTGVAAATSRSNSMSPNQGGRIARPIRRRSRAPRRTPTTLLSTDATNFRAMVQQFTGVPTTTTVAASGPQLLHAATTTTTTASASQASMFHNLQYYPNQMQLNHMFMHDGGGNMSSHAPPGSS